MPYNILDFTNENFDEMKEPEEKLLKIKLSLIFEDYKNIDNLWTKLDIYGSKKLSIQELKILCNSIDP